MFSHLFGLSPVEQDGMWVDEWELYRGFADRWIKSQGGGK